MFIRNLSIACFRGLETIDIKMKNNMLAVVGQNDVGKSTILRALRVFLEDEKITSDDFSKTAPNSPVEIEIQFETTRFPRIQHNGLLRIRQVYNISDTGKIAINKQCYHKLPIPTEAEFEDYRLVKKNMRGIELGLPRSTAKG